MQAFSALLAFCAGNSPVTGKSTPPPPQKKKKKGQWRWALTFTSIDIRRNNVDAYDLRRHFAHYDVIVMIKSYIPNWIHVKWYLSYSNSIE